jgi:hypothetical protein
MQAVAFLALHGIVTPLFLLRMATVVMGLALGLVLRISLIYCRIDRSYKPVFGDDAPALIKHRLL